MFCRPNWTYSIVYGGVFHIVIGSFIMLCNYLVTLALNSILLQFDICRIMLPVGQVVAFFSASISTRFQLNQFPREMTISIRIRMSGFDLDFVYRNQNLVPDNFNLGRITFGGICLNKKTKQWVQHDFLKIIIMPRKIIESKFKIFLKCSRKFFYRRSYGCNITLAGFLIEIKTKIIRYLCLLWSQFH